MASIMLHLPRDHESRTVILDRVADLNLDTWEYSPTMLRVTGDPAPIVLIETTTIFHGGATS